jgi:poly-gamma-glutamate synthesis protein (capsule biosynthesis protein)
MPVLDDLPRLLLDSAGSASIPWRVRPWVERALLAVSYTNASPPRFDLQRRPVRAVLLFGGDIALHKVKKGDAPEAVLRHLGPVFEGADLKSLNLETVLTRHAEPSGQIGAFLRAIPESIGCLQFLDVGVVSCANNHVLDYGGDGLAESITHLRGARMHPLGITEDPSQGTGDSAPAVVTVRDLRVGLLAATDHFGGIPARHGPSPVWLDAERMVHDVARLRQACDIVVVQLHWGYEWSMYPMRWHRDLARRYAEAGAHLVICHHAHVVMGVEVWKGSIIAHGLGNFWFGRSRRPRHPLGHHGILIRLSVDRDGVIGAEVIPVWTDRDGVLHGAAAEGGDACPGFDRLCRDLANDSYLGLVQASRIAHETATLAQDIRARARRSDVNGLLERRAFLEAPRQAWLLDEAVDADDSDLRRLGEALATFRSLSEEALHQLRIPAFPESAKIGRWLDSRSVAGRLP